MGGRYVGETAVGIAAAVRSGQVSPTEVLEQHLARIAAVDGRVGAFRLLRTDKVRAEARALEQQGGLRNLALAGVPVAIKDNVAVAGTRPATARPRPARSRPRPTTSWSGACGRRGRCWSARPTCPSWVCGRSPRARRSGSPATPGAWTTPR